MEQQTKLMENKLYSNFWQYGQRLPIAFILTIRTFMYSIVEEFSIQYKQNESLQRISFYNLKTFNDKTKIVGKI